MNKILTTKFNLTSKKAAFVLIGLVLIFVVLTLVQDYLRSEIKNSAFYFSESFIFSSFWWLFAPILFVQYFAAMRMNKNRVEFRVALVILPILIHLYSFPFLVWSLSKLFYYHTYSFQQTFRYALSEHLYQMIFIYSVPFVFFLFIVGKVKLASNVTEIQDIGTITQFVSNIIVTDGYKKHTINVLEICYLSANPPYINIHLEGKRYLHNETLKSISAKLNPDQFVRVHKSTIVNIEMVAYFTTRLNGDYDLMMKNNVQLRLSRNFASDFKKLLSKTHRLTIK